VTSRAQNWHSVRRRKSPEPARQPRVVLEDWQLAEGPPVEVLETPPHPVPGDVNLARFPEAACLGPAHLVRFERRELPSPQLLAVAICGQVRAAAVVSTSFSLNGPSVCHRCRLALSQLKATAARTADAAGISAPAHASTPDPRDLTPIHRPAGDPHAQHPAHRHRSRRTDCPLAVGI
jgi:hypothetical protein